MPRAPEIGLNSANGTGREIKRCQFTSRSTSLWRIHAVQRDHHK